jgi:hypothetical protein
LQPLKMTDTEVRETNASATVMKKPQNLPDFWARRPSRAMLVEVLAWYAQGK